MIKVSEMSSDVNFEHSSLRLKNTSSYKVSGTIFFNLYFSYFFTN